MCRRPTNGYRASVWEAVLTERQLGAHSTVRQAGASSLPPPSAFIYNGNLNLQISAFLSADSFPPTKKTAASSRSHLKR